MHVLTLKKEKKSKKDQDTHEIQVSSIKLKNRIFQLYDLKPLEIPEATQMGIIHILNLF